MKENLKLTLISYFFLSEQTSTSECLSFLKRSGIVLDKYEFQAEILRARVVLEQEFQEV